MEGGASGGGGGPAPFLLKTYEMVDDASTNDIVSWSSTNASFVVWNHTEFAARLLPTYFKHNNFSSFIRQLNTYGFRKIDPERWEFSNDDFVKGQKHLLKNIHRRKPIHSHSHPSGGVFPDAERTALEDEVEQLSREKSSLESSLFKVKEQQSGTEIQIEDLERRVMNMEQRQLKMVAFLQRAMKNPQLMESLTKMASATSIDVSAINRKRRLPSDGDYCRDCSDNSFCDDTGFMLDQDFCEKLKLGLCSAVPADSDVVILNAQHFDLHHGTVQAIRQIDCDHELPECPPQASETLQLRDAGAPVSPSKNDLFARAVDEDDVLLPCRLSLTLSMEIDADDLSSSTQRHNDLNTPVAGMRSMTADSAADAEAVSCEANDASSAPSGGTNDVFWQQFLTERPGSNPIDGLNEERMPGLSKKDKEQL
ncbi:heat stress transcription factor A-5-like [Zingiber officinale]|uniref:HSF-type DNA-binding domain-containing protein n=1 Tax=Zingiber officinale TaxID=94328 RepID=A0A8J5I951_ZINOF|nr:heat stress transcription factor A-5-like [Zingiber officinale]XP_042466128.1 heat stress transcription factor A-5-like [Zingiber officinale]KAG6531180.1 hypothetical protein ZIOFF_004954 [Zingiber officinale]